jgi:hypothetical protein
MTRDGTVALDDAMTARHHTCTWCGTRPPQRDAWGDIVAVPGVGSVHIIICQKCARHWEHLEAQVLMKLQERYRV